MTGYRMADNPFNSGLRDRLRAQRHGASGHRQYRVGGDWRWHQRADASGATHTGLLQSPDAVVDVTDHGAGVYPLVLSGRTYLRCALLADGAGPDARSSHRVDDLGLTAAAAERTATFDTGRYALCPAAGAGIAATTWLDEELPLLVWDFDVPDGVRDLSLVLVSTGGPGVPGAPGRTAIAPDVVPPADPDIAHNNSRLPDPPRPADLDPALLTVALDGGPLDLRPRPLPDARHDRIALADRWFDAGELVLRTAPVPTARRVRVVVAITAGAGEADRALSAWQGLGEAARDERGRRWERRVAGVSVRCGAPEIDDQLPYAVYNALSARARTDEGRSVFLHGRRDRGYADAACPHQSYQMHLPALAANWTEPVREELSAFAALQDDRGYLARQPRPGVGWHPYAGQYSNAHFVLAAHRYVSWTGDAGLLDAEVTAAVDARTTRTMAERVELAADWLAHRMPAGLLPPCGWCDAWPPDVVAQGQISAAGILAFRAAAELAALRGDDRRADVHRDRAARLRTALRATLLDPETGVLAEHLYADGAIRGGEPDDMWVPTQIWSALAGVPDDPAAVLREVGRRCLDRGLRAITLGSADRAYLADSTDNYDALSLHSTMTWLAASWPELTHLYALALLDAGAPDAALAAVRAQLPERLAAANPAVPAHFYAEKYLYPGDEPWLCTWAGDPTLVEVALCGFAGVRPGPSGLTVAPRVPSGLAGPLRAEFWWRGRRYRLTVTGTGGTVTDLRADGVAYDPGAPLPPGTGTGLTAVVRP